MNARNSEGAIPDEAWPAIFAELGLFEQERDAEGAGLVGVFDPDGL